MGEPADSARDRHRRWLRSLHVPHRMHVSQTTGRIPILPTGELPVVSTGTIPVIRIESATARSWIVWTIGLVAYVAAVLQRSSFGVAGSDAGARFHVDAAALSVFVVLQVAAYAAGQIPVGIMLDRFGARWLLVGGAVLMSVGQAIVAVGDTFPVAVAGRVLVGFGDAATFISVLRVIPAWFPTVQVPVVTQVTGIVGQFGQILSAVPFLALLHVSGWTSAFLSAGAMCLVTAALVAAAFRDSPKQHRHRKRPPLRFSAIRSQLRYTWGLPGTRLAVLVHAMCLGGSNVFPLLWGVPYVLALGYEPWVASMLLTVFTLSGVVFGPVMGALTASMFSRRFSLAIAAVVATLTGWLVLVAWPGIPPVWLLIPAVILQSLGNPGSAIAFDIARTTNPARTQGLASGFANMGGFTSTLLSLLGVGWLLDVTHAWTGAPLYSQETFRVALCLPFAVVGVALAAALMLRRHVRRLG